MKLSLVTVAIFYCNKYIIHGGNYETKHNRRTNTAGINIYEGTVQGLSREDCIYIPSLTIRSETKSKVLAGTVFYGILRIDFSM